jgi:hypothetical protein
MRREIDAVAARPQLIDVVEIHRKARRVHAM